MVLDWVWMMALPLIATVAAWTFNLNFLTATLLYFVMPSVYLAWRKPKLIEKTLKFCLLTVLPFYVIFDHLAYLDQSWFVPNSAMRFLRDSLPIEDLVWSAAWMFFVIAWWEFFVDRGRDRPKFSNKIKYLVTIMTVLSIIFGLLYWLKPEWLHVPYFYLNLAIFFMLIPMVIAIWHTKNLIPKLWPLGIYFLIVSALTEWVGLTHNHWYFAGRNYLGVLQMWGRLLPVDEVLFWWVLGAPALICWYEIFADDWK